MGYNIVGGARMNRATLLLVCASLMIGSSLAQPNLVYRLHGHQESVIFDISPSGEWLITVDKAYAKAWNLFTGRVEAPHNRVGHVHSLCFLPNIDEFVWSGHSTPLTLYRFFSPNEFTSLGWYPFFSYSTLTGYKVASSPQYGVFALASTQGLILVRGYRVDVIERYGGPYDVAFSADGSVLASLNGSGEVSLWRVSDLTRLTVYRPPFSVTTILFAPNGDLLLGGHYGQLARWSPRTNTFVQVNAPIHQYIQQMALAPAGDLLATVVDNRVLLWYTEPLELLGELERPNHVESILSARFSPTGQHLYTSGDKGHVDRWLPSSLQHDEIITREWWLRDFRAGTHELWMSVGTHDYLGTYTYAYSAEGRITRIVPYVGEFSNDKKWVLTPRRQLVRVSDGFVAASFCYGFRCIVVPAFSPDSTLFFAVVIDSGGPSYMIMYDLRRNVRPLWWQNLQGHWTFIRLQIDKSNRFVLISTLGFVEVRETRRGNVVWRYDNPAPHMVAALSDDGSYLALAVDEGNQTRLDIYAMPSGQLVYSEMLPVPNVRRLRYVVDSRYLAVVAEGLVVFYDTSSWQRVYEDYFEDVILLGDTGRFIPLPTQGMVYTYSMWGEMDWVARYELAPLRSAKLSDDGRRLALQYADNTIEVVRMLPVPGDLNYDGCVDDADLLQVLQFFGESGLLGGDVNRDGRVDDADLLIVLMHFGDGC
jgi:WD40 repeat protein